jgi:hypothetical protein
MPNKYLKFRNGLAVVLSLAALSPAVFAQGTSGCVAPPSAINGMSLEQVLSLTNVLSVQAAPAPPGVLNGTQEIHQSFVLDPLNATVQITTFFVAKGSPVPTPPTAITAANTLQLSTVQVNQIMAGSNPAPSLIIVGTAINSPPGGFPSHVGGPVVITMGYVSPGTTDRLAIVNQVNNFALVSAGQVIAWTATATGTLSLGYPPSGSVSAYCGS